MVEYTEKEIEDFDASESVGFLVTNSHYDKIQEVELEEVKGNH
jgi:hypothetical protein